MSAHIRFLALALGVTLALPVLAQLDIGQTPAAAASPAWQQSKRGAAKVNPDGYTSARICGECHVNIYESWKRSLHAFSLTDPIFDTAYMQAVKEVGEEARKRCLHCHAPMTMMNGDYDLKEGVSREGVSCDFCHTVTAVHLDGRDKPYSIELGLVKRGVIRQTSSPAHEVAYSALHGKSEFCGGCHNYLTPEGRAIIGTYDEWRAGPYAAEGVQCQNCHMVMSPGKVAVEGGLQPSSEFHLHSLIHDSAQLRSALALQIVRAERSGNLLVAEVMVENVGSGHMVPTGLPTREVVLRVEVESGGHVRSAERRYRKVVADKSGRPLQSDYRVLLHGARILNDNRIAPREKRIESFRFPVRGTDTVRVTAELAYQYSPAMLSVKDMNIPLGKSERYVR